MKYSLMLSDSNAKIGPNCVNYRVWGGGGSTRSKFAEYILRALKHPFLLSKFFFILSIERQITTAISFGLIPDYMQKHEGCINAHQLRRNPTNYSSDNFGTRFSRN